MSSETKGSGMTTWVTGGYPVSELRRKPKEGDECVCGALFEDGRWWSNHLNRVHDGQHKPWKLGTWEQYIAVGEAQSE